ncbi:MAG: hypothetical protein JO115_05770 [Pseudonocardiales bacterium]|nr:hypothetical protein [Pseudonocardiales bacterium]
MTEAPQTRRRSLTVLSGTCALALVLVGCSSHTASSPPISSSADCPQVQTASFDKTKFALHSGLGLGAFHHFIYRPFQSGGFSSGTPGRVRRLAEAGLATAFTVHELRLAREDAAANPTLCKVVAAPLGAAAASLQRLRGSVSSGRVSSGDLDGVNSDLDQAQRGSAQSGNPVTEQVPTPEQLAHPT